MFFKKHRDAKKAAAQEARQNIIAEFQTQFDAAGQCADPGEKILRLQNICNEVDTALAIMNGKAAKDAVKKQRAFFWTATPSAIAASATFPPALIGIAAIAASVYGGKKLSKKFGARAQRKLLEREKPFIDALEAQKNQALAAQDAMVSENPRAVAASKHFSDLLANVPRLREHLAAAYGKQVAEDNTKKPEAPKGWTGKPEL